MLVHWEESNRPCMAASEQGRRALPWQGAITAGEGVAIAKRYNSTLVCLLVGTAKARLIGQSVLGDSCTPAVSVTSLASLGRNELTNKQTRVVLYYIIR